MCRNNEASIRDHQRQVLEKMAAGITKMVYIAGVGSRKSVVFTLPAFAIPSTTTVVIQPKKCLQRETHIQLQRQGIKSYIFGSDDDDDAVPSVILVTPEGTATPTWKSMIAEEVIRNNIDRVILGEAHEVLINSAFRPQLERCVTAMDTISPRQIFMAGTLPPSMEREFKMRMGLAQDVCTIRSSCTRPNIRFKYMDREGDVETLAQSSTPS
ncbi:hypothetical protein F5144DRAFT_480813 [Chaetomium tenue]|uniref:Uncharacterized protein n=1 Tax=Chaetomium tenue TaxID=1854479 RepID=A0ACB7PQ29_9PEZI|nr:hypothetical protein F5144DRAFT_480813 [Chaetomium globosum]